MAEARINPDLESLARPIESLHLDPKNARRHGQPACLPAMRRSITGRVARRKPAHRPPAAPAPALGTSVEVVPISQLTPHPDNPRRGREDLIGDSIAANGFFGAVVAQRSTGRVLVGNHRMRAAAARGVAEILVHWVDVDDAHALRIMLADNRASDVATYDERLLADLLRGAVDDGLIGTGYDEAHVDALMRRTSQVDVAPQLAAVRFSLQVDDLNETQQRDLVRELSGRGFSVRALMF